MKIFLLVLAMGALCWGQNPNDDIERVKLAFAKLSFATQTAAVENALVVDQNMTYENLVKAIATNAVTFQISVLSSGDIAKIATVPFSKIFAESLAGPAICIWGADTGASDGTVSLSEHGAMPQWRPGPAETREWENMPFVEGMKAGDWQLGYKNTAPTRFVLMKLTTKWGTRSLTRNVIALVGNDLMFVDPPSGQPMATEFATESPYPEVLLSHLTNPAVKRWFSENSTHDETGHGNVICNLEALTCGVAAGDLREEKRKLQRRAHPVQN